MFVRCTAKVLAVLGVRRSSLPEPVPAGEDWYLNLLWVDRRECLLATQAQTAFSVFVPDVGKAQMQPLGSLLAAAITHALDAEDLTRDALGDLDGQVTQLAPTGRRRVLGLMNDMAVQIGYAVGDHGGPAGVDAAHLNRPLQRQINAGLNVVESWNRANSVIFYGKGGDIATNRRDEQEMAVACLRILQAALVFVYTLMIQDVLADPDWAETLSPADRRGLTPLFWAHLLPYGEVRLDMASRLRLSGS